MKKFLHIGHDHFNPELFNPIKNDPEFDNHVVVFGSHLVKVKRE